MTKAAATEKTVPPSRRIREPRVAVRFSGDIERNRDAFIGLVTARMQRLMLENGDRGPEAQERACLAALRDLAASMPPHTRRRVCVAVRGVLDGRLHEVSFDFGTVRGPRDDTDARIGPTA